METEAGETETVSAVHLVLLSLMLLRAGVLPCRYSVLSSPCFVQRQDGYYFTRYFWNFFHVMFLCFLGAEVQLLRLFRDESKLDYFPHLLTYLAFCSNCH